MCVGHVFRPSECHNPTTNPSLIQVLTVVVKPCLDFTSSDVSWGLLTKKEGGNNSCIRKGGMSGRSLGWISSCWNASFPCARTLGFLWNSIYSYKLPPAIWSDAVQTQVLFCGKGKYSTEFKQLLLQNSSSGWLALALLKRKLITFCTVSSFKALKESFIKKKLS